MDVDDILELGKPWYMEADAIPCTGEEPGEAEERGTLLQGAVLNGPPSTCTTPEFSKQVRKEMPSTSSSESSTQEAVQKTGKE